MSALGTTSHAHSPKQILQHISRPPFFAALLLEPCAGLLFNGQLATAQVRW